MQTSHFSRTLTDGRLLIIFLAILFLPRGIAAAAEIIDPFTFSSAALAQLYVQSGRILYKPFNPVDDWQWHANGLSDRVAAPLLLAVLSEVTSLRIGTLVYAPIGGVAFSLLAYTIAHKITKSRAIGMIYAAIQAWDVQVITATNNLFYVTVGYVMMMLFIAFYLKSTESPKKEIHLMPFVIFSVAILAYYAAEFLVIEFAFSMYLFTSLIHRSGRDQKHSLYLPLSLLSLAAVFETLSYRAYFFAFNPNTAITILVGYLQYLLGLSFRAGGQIQRYATGTTSAPILYISDLLYRILLVACTSAYILFAFMNRIKHGREFEKQRRTSVFVLTFIFLIAGHIFVYAFVGLLNLRGVYFFLPLVALMFIQYARQRFSAIRAIRHLPSLAAVILIVLVVLRFGLFFVDTAHPYAVDEYSKNAPGLSFLVNHSPENGTAKAVTNLDISAQLFYQATSFGKTTLLSYHFAADSIILYSSDPRLAPDTMRNEGYTFLLVSRTFGDRVISTDGWNWEPPAKHLTKVVPQSPGLNLIYQDGQILIFALS